MKCKILLNVINSLILRRIIKSKLLKLIMFNINGTPILFWKVMNMPMMIKNKKYFKLIRGCS